MTYRIEYSESALSDIASALEYISIVLENPASARKLVAKIFERCDALNFMPKASRVRLTVNNKDFRYIHVNHFTIVYFVDDEKMMVQIYAVLYSRRNIENILQNRR